MDARIELGSIATERGEDGRPVDPGTEFAAGSHAIYLFFSYSGMENGVARTFAWYKDGEFWPRCSSYGLWDWGARGATHFYCRPSDGWEPGEYEIRVFVEFRLQGIARFVVSE